MKKQRKLKDIEVDEISLVDKPANRVKFLIVKNEDDEEGITVNDLFDVFFGIGCEGDYYFDKLDEDKKQELKSAIEEVAKLYDDMPDELQIAIKTNGSTPRMITNRAGGIN